MALYAPSCVSMNKKCFKSLYNLPQFSTLVGAIRHGWRIEVGQPGRLIQPTRWQSWKLRSPVGQVIMGGIFLGTFLLLLTKKSTSPVGAKTHYHQHHGLLRWLRFFTTD